MAAPVADFPDEETPMAMMMRAGSNRGCEGAVDIEDVSVHEAGSV